MFVLAWLSALAGTPQPPPPTVVVITLDTTRADALSCYGQPPDIRRSLPPVTPHIDALAAEGLRFEAAFAHAPTTLSSHASILTGLDPHQHGIPHNGRPLPRGLPTLAERLRGAGYHTIAVVGSSALSASMGLERGFAVYDDSLSGQVATQVEDSADAVIDRAMAQLDGRPRSQPLFLWVHLFDAHAPYAAPSPFRDRFSKPGYSGIFSGGVLRPRTLLPALGTGEVNPEELDYIASRYLGEVSFVDDQIGRLVGRLRTEGLLDRALLVVTADHGETLSEDPTRGWSHGFDVADEVMRVPLVIRGFGLGLGGPGVVRRSVGLASIAPTVETLAGLAPTLGTAGDLFNEVRPGPVWDEEGWPDRPARTIFGEATRTRGEPATSGWNNLGLPRSVRAGGAWAARDGNEGETLKMREGAMELLPVLRALMQSWDADAPENRSSPIPSQTRRALEALGYSHPALDSGG